MRKAVTILLMTLFGVAIAGCSGGGGASNPPPSSSPPAADTDTALRAAIASNGLTGAPTAGRILPLISDPLPQLGMKLFFSKSLSGDLDTACASCHHPALAGGDGLSLPVGTGAVDPDVVGPGRHRADGLPNVGRHSQSVFNIGLYDSGMFWDSRVESINKDAGQNGVGSGIRTPDTPLNVGDPLAGESLPAAQARFPVTVDVEMRGSLMPTADSDAVRDHLAARIGDYGSGLGELQTNNWLAEFQTTFASAESAEELITFDNIALAIAEYQRSMVFVDTPWKAYVEGDDNAISETAKRGALLFYGDAPDDGAGCVQCHSGDFFTDEEHHNTAFPQLGPGKGDGAAGDGDFGREQQTASTADRFKFRTPTLLNITATAPYSHSGVYESLSDSISHYALPELIFGFFKDRGGVCSLSQFATHSDCPTMFPRVEPYFLEALDSLEADRAIDPDSVMPNISNRPPSDADLMNAFLQTLTDPCVLDRACTAPWIPDPSDAPDEHQLNAVDVLGNPL